MLAWRNRPRLRVKTIPFCPLDFMVSRVRLVWESRVGAPARRL